MKLIEKKRMIKSKKKDIKNSFSIKEVVFLLIATSLVSLVMGYAISNKEYKRKIENGKIDQITSDEYLQEFIDNYDYIVNNYYEDIDKSKILSGAINGMVESLGDDYSVSIENENYFNIRLTGSYSGIGVQIVNDSENNIVVYEVFDDSPAQKAGLKPMDIILSIDDTNLSNTKTTTLSNYVKENNKEQFKLKVLRDNQQIEMTITREIVTLQSVASEIIEKNNKKVGYIYISVFAANTASQFVDAVNDLESKNIDSLIIDVRDNTGGHLTAVVDMLSCLLDSNKVIYQIQIKDDIKKYYSNGKTTKKYPIVILQNNNSASASELLSSAMQEQYKATVIGTTSYGKGTVQELVTLSNGTEYKFTTKKWLTSNGTWINEVGVKPDIEIELSDNYKTNPSNETDNQLQSALEYLTK
ncbi:MAG: S41 family peptidase [Bacilli bacterium]|nr:S41 family peptidase [Bacilli bacterium]